MKTTNCNRSKDRRQPSIASSNGQTQQTRGPTRQSQILTCGPLATAPTPWPLLHLLRILGSSSSDHHRRRVVVQEGEGGSTDRSTMPRGGFSGSLSSPKIDVAIDLGNPFVNRTVDGFLKIGAVAACKVAAEETFDCLHRRDVSKQKLEHTLKKMCKEGAYWGTVAGVYVGMEYGVERIRGRYDWKNAMIGGALSGALISAASSNHRDKIFKDAITGGAVATAVEFINYLT
ncbi:hypothetical protein GUJ93_ZPchr0005g15821 [Zizania palustris]|uniref:Uncharacterized protein n=1 Tax=Zizania palustris TaxID=103762 RepID=A0A8J5S1U8_ZIZPA|nr:hypothetical protein GUJ93_ZPchr0005g15821 [Zizania palustris]